MNSLAATLEPGGPVAEDQAENRAGDNQVSGKDVAEKQVAGAAAKSGGAVKFLYASGARPLDGFTIKRGIGRGGFGEVYFAVSDAGKEVALKHVERNLEVELRGVSQCLNLKHVNLIDLYDVRYDEQGDAWVVMEYVGGPSLKDVVDRNPNGLPMDQVEHWFRGIAAGVAYLHNHGIVHRDLKPGNIFDDGGRVKIGDYGLSKFISCSRKSGQTESVGTFHYMAPEIGKGVYGKEIDVYALGIILFEMITGRVPFEGESSQEIIMKHLTADPDLAGVPQPYRGVIQRAMQKDPDKRYKSVDEMLSAIAHGGAGSSGTVLKTPPVRVAVAQALAAPKSDPLYIGDDDEGMEFGPVQLHPVSPKSLIAQGLDGKVLATGSGAAAANVDEPIAKAVRESCKRFARWWNHSPMGMPVKITLLITAAVLAIMNGTWLLPAAIAIGSVYLVYLGIRLLTNTLRAPVAPALAAQPLPTPAGIRSPGWKSLSSEKQGRQLLCMKTAGDLVGEFTGSVLAAAMISGVLTVVLTVIAGEALDNSANPLAGPVWLWLNITLGSSLLLGLGKFFERTSGEAVKRRCIMLVLGLAFGALSFLTSRYLMVAMQDGVIARSIVSHEISRRMYESSGAPLASAFMAYFGAVFLTVRWWKQTDPLRASRLRIGPILITFVAAWLWQLVWPFPQPWGFMTVVAISIVTQLSAPWMSPKERTAAIARRKQEMAV